VPGRKLGHFKSRRAYAHFLRVYQAGMADLPSNESTDAPTSFGTVRVYRFDGPSAGAPVVVLPGRNASTPMWRANLPGLLQHRSVIGVDLLGVSIGGWTAVNYAARRPGHAASLVLLDPAEISCCAGRSSCGQTRAAQLWDAVDAENNGVSSH
jgi:pimeloyl-ACP methyl ester carboxylesterase